MSMLTVSCPSCGFSRQVPAEKVPDGPRRVTCPRCKEVFVYTKPLAHGQEAESHPAPTLVESPSSAPPVPPRVAIRHSLPSPPAPSGNRKRIILAGCILVPMVLMIALAVSLSGKLRETTQAKGFMETRGEGELRVITFPPVDGVPAGPPAPAGGETPSSAQDAASSPATENEQHPENIHIFIYAVNYAGTVTANGTVIQKLGEKPDMQYNYNLNGKGLRYGQNRIEVDFSEIPVPSSSLLEVHIKISRSTPDRSTEILGDWRFSDKGSGKKVFDFEIAK